MPYAVQNCDSPALLYGQDVAAVSGAHGCPLARNSAPTRLQHPIQAFIIGSTAGTSAAGLRPIVEVQLADWLWPGLNQLFTELSRSYFLSNGQAHSQPNPRSHRRLRFRPLPQLEHRVCWPTSGIKVVYPSNGADLKGLLVLLRSKPCGCARTQRALLVQNTRHEAARSSSPTRPTACPSKGAHGTEVQAGEKVLARSSRTDAEQFCKPRR